MYATCLFCNNALGANEALEHFPVGRRLAYDPAKGRLWVVCRKCERWNLSPLETRWEAIEEAEKAFRATHLRVSSDNIGMAQLKEGVELVRIGAAERPEFAAWRYGDQFGKRYRKYRLASIAAMGVAIPFALSGVANFTGLISPAVKVIMDSWGMTGTAISMTATLGFNGYLKYHALNTNQIPRISVRDNDGHLLRLTRGNASGAKLIPASRKHDWHLSVPHVAVQPAKGIAKRLGHREMVLTQNASSILTGDAAQRALGKLLPVANALGGNKRAVSDALDTINNATDVQSLLRHGGFPDPMREHMIDLELQRHALGTLEPRYRLALEMVLHDGDEQRAMDGELKELEQRWREAEEIAKIADDMFLPENVSAQVESEISKKTRIQ
ncbi:MAG: hypothetical protein ABI852_00605 [Gemmatimonadaceae bacterium]